MIQIIPYQSRWPGEFRALGAELRAALGPRALAIHHIGSTSVPGLAAKDIIDIQVTVAELEPSLTPPAGYEPTSYTTDHCPPGLTLAAHELEKRYFRSPKKRVHLHVRTQGAFNQRYALLFRDFLRANEMARNAYGEIKIQLAKHFPENVEASYDVKDPVCDALMVGANEWAARSNWKPGATDA
jgi:GrpB-like predicted nucleotidyltransferase (UPF0157 family)